MQLAIYSGVNTLYLPVMLVAMLKDGLKYVMPWLANLYVCAEYVSQFLSVLYGMITNILTSYGRKIMKNVKKIIIFITLNMFQGSFA